MSSALIPPDALEGLMRKVFLEGSLQSGLFWDALLKANLYIPLKGDSGEVKKMTVEEGEESEYPILLGMDPQNKYVLWVFTSPTVMETYTEAALSFVEAPSTRVFEKIKELPYEIVLIGPSGLTLGLHPELVDSLSEGQVPEMKEEYIRHIPKEAEVFVGPPVEVTKDLEEKFTSLFRDLANVREACFIQVSDDTGSRLLLGLRLEQENREELRKVSELVAKAAEGILSKGGRIDITLIEGTLKGAFAKHGKSFYVR